MALNRTIDLVAEVLASIARPATAKEIVDLASRDLHLRRLVSGRTPFKTINARLALDILKNGSESKFYRYAPGTYGLRSLAECGVYNPKYLSEYLGVNRRKQIAKECVATIATSDLVMFNRDGMYGSEHYPISILSFLDVNYVDREAAELSDDVRQLVSYVYLRHAKDIIAFERGNFTADGGEFIGKQSIGFGGHINDLDRDLLDQSFIGLYRNIERELFEELSVLRKKVHLLIDQVKFRGFLKDSTTANGRRHLGVVAEVILKEKIELRNSSLGIRNLRWISSCNTPNSFADFEVWSQYLFRFIQDEHECRIY